MNNKSLKTKSKKIQEKESVKRSLNNYIEQLKIHFSISDDDIDDIMNSVIKSRKKLKPFWKGWLNN